MKFVFGNNDGEKAGLNKMASEYGWEKITDEKEFDYGGKKFYVYHGTNKEKLEPIRIAAKKTGAIIQCT